MKITFLNIGIGEKKTTKIIEITSIHDFTDVIDFALCECEMHLPDDEKELELVPADGLEMYLSRKYTVVYDGWRNAGVVLMV